MNTDYDANKDPDRLEQEIDEQRREINETLRMLEEKFSSREIAAQFMHYFGGPGREFVGGLGSSLKSNPVPSLLTGIGLAWLMMSDHKGPVPNDPYTRANRSMFEGAGSAAHEAADTLREKAGEFGDRASQAGEALGEKAGQARASLRSHTANAREGINQSAEAVRSNFEHLMREQPLALGAIGIALGAIVGAALPRTAPESRAFGRAGERLKEKASEMAEEAYETASEKAAEVAEVAGETLQRNAQEPKPQAGNTSPP